MVAFAVVNTYLLASSASLMIELRWVARVQFAPALLAGSLAIVALTLMVTLLLGRIYCSTLCPMGFVQDIASHLHRHKHQYHYSAPRNRVRLTVVILVASATLAGSSLLLALTDPYGAYGRIATYLLRPLISSGSAEVAFGAGIIATLVAAVTLIGIAAWANRKGRAWCGTICPVGTTLGAASRFAVMHIDIDTDRCINCRHCEHACKSECIDLQSHVIDMSRCVVCFDCLPVCPNDAIHYTHRRHQLAMPMMMKIGREDREPGVLAMDSSRRKFLVTGALMATTPLMAKVEKTIDPIASHKSAPHRPVPPPGTRSVDSLLRKCVGCGECVAVCPQKVIVPSVSQYGILHPLVPHLDFDRSYCRWDCDDCTHVCPTGALLPLTLHEKQNTAIGLATVDPDRCVGCGRCARACPRHAIAMITPAGHDRRVAMVDHSDCIGCGACQNVCPVDPKAVVVSGLRR